MLFSNHWLLSFLVCLSIATASIAHAQGLPGSPSPPSPRGGTSAGGPLIPGKTDSQRWSFLQAHERSFLGMSKSQIIRIFGQEGGPGLDNNQLVYQITKGTAKGRTQVMINFDDKQKCNQYTVAYVPQL